MITEEQFKRAKQIGAEIDELTEMLKDFTVNDSTRLRATMGLLSRRDHDLVRGHDGAARFNYSQKDLIMQLNTTVVSSLRNQINTLKAELQEYVS